MHTCTIVWECMCASLSLSFCCYFLSFDGSETLIKINITGFVLHLINGFFSLVTLVFPFIPWDVWNWKPSSFSKVGSKFFFFLSFFLWIHTYSKVQHALSLSLSLSLSFQPPSPHSSVPFQFYITYYSLHHTHYTSLSCQQSSMHRTSCKNSTKTR